VSWLSPVQRRLISIACSKATLVLDDLSERRLALHAGDGQPSYPAYGAELPLTRELTEFVAAVRAGQRDPRHVQMGVSVARAIAATEESIQRGGQSVTILREH
jgi:predicted dehydrogenase